MEGYLIPAGYGEIEYIEKRSRFIGRVWYTPTEAEALEHIREMREKHWDASHNVYAYSIHGTGATRYSDDGEPSGTSGMPVLGVFKARETQDFCCVVTRYFGGILLGAGGLVRAYSKAASMALEAAGLARMRELAEVTVVCAYNHFERVRAELWRSGGELEGAEYGADVELRVLIPPEDLPGFEARVTELTSGASLFEITGRVEKPVGIKNS